MRSFVTEVFARHRGLGLVGAFNLVAAAVFLMLMLVDQTTVLGINRWVKPFKFGMSVGIYLWTVAWFLPYLRVAKKTTAGIGWVIAFLLFFENALLFMQAVRGTTSHFNNDTVFDGVVFGLMGILILLNSIMLFVLLGLFAFHASDAPRPWIWAIRIGLLLLILGSVEGAYMIGNGGHSIGAPDGGEGLPLIHWNTEAGDLRPAHLIGLHGVQVIPLFAFWIGRLRLSQAWQLALVFGFSLAYAALGGFLFWQAVRGIPMLSI